MNLEKFDPILEDYLNKITLTDSQNERVDSALNNVLAVLLEEFADAEIYAQGSYSTDTQSKPLTEAQGSGEAGEYDIDIAVEREAWTGARESLESIEALLESDRIYGQMEIVKTKQSCVRIRYAKDDSGVGFHVDIVPTRPEGESRCVPLRDDDEWKSSNSKKFADWFNGEAMTKPNLRKVAVIIKRLRDLAGMNEAISSILVLALVSEDYEQNDYLMQDLLGVLHRISGIFADEEQAPSIDNPVNKGEDLMDRVDDYGKVRAFFVDAYDQLRRALAEDDARKLESFFGPGFKYEKAKTVSAAPLAATPLIAQPRAYGVPDGQAD
jgi:hypothetical protein